MTDASKLNVPITWIGVSLVAATSGIWGAATWATGLEHKVESAVELSKANAEQIKELTEVTKTRESKVDELNARIGEAVDGQEETNALLRDILRNQIEEPR